MRQEEANMKANDKLLYSTWYYMAEDVTYRVVSPIMFIFVMLDPMLITYCIHYFGLSAFISRVLSPLAKIRTSYIFRSVYSRYIFVVYV
jgi:hypothetical protein